MLILSCHGCPRYLVSDGTLNKSSAVIWDFSRSKNILAVIISAHNPVSNGKAEAAVKLVKSLLNKNKNDAMTFSKAPLV